MLVDKGQRQTPSAACPTHELIAGGGKLPLRCSREGIVSHEDQGSELAGVLRGLDLTSRVAPPFRECSQESRSNVIHGLFRPRAASKAKARQPLGSGALSPPAITYHTMLSSLEAEGGLNLVDCTWPEGTHVPSHVHPAEDELLIMLAGTVEVRIAERTFRCGAGETLFTPRNTEHEVRALSKARHIAILTRRSLERPRTV